MTSGARVLADKFRIGATAETVADADADRTLLDTSGPTNASVSLYVSQTVSGSDIIADNYTITITFTVTPK